MEDPSLYSADELNPPEWMNGDFFTEVLKSSQNDTFNKIIEYKIEPATVKGDHYASIMFRGIIKYLDSKADKQEISLIIKTMPEVEGNKKELFSETSIFATEIKMFRDVIPKYEEKLKSIGDNSRLSAKMLYSSLSPKQIIVLEDITKIGYSTVGRKARLCTLNEVKMALDILAKWHACSLVVNEETKGSLENFKNGVFVLPGTENNPVFTDGTKRLTKVIKEIPKFQKYIEKLEKIQDLVYPKSRHIYDVCRKQGLIHVLNHGDFHVKNLMFNFNSNTKLAETIMLIDFQLCVWGSPVLDLLYTLYLMMDYETRETHQEELIYNYFCKFQEVLRKLNYKGNIPTFSDLQKEFILLRGIEVFMATTFLPYQISMVEAPEKCDHESIMDNEDVQLNMFKSKKYHETMKPILKRFLYRGYLDSVIED